MLHSGPRSTSNRPPKELPFDSSCSYTSPGRNKTLRWSVEWVHPDGTKTMSMCPENQPIPEAYAAHLDSLDPWRDTKRRKLDHKQSEVSNLNDETQPHPEEPPSDIPKPLARPTEPLVSDVTTDDTLIADIRDECSSPRTDNFPDSSSRKRLKRRKALDDQSHKPQVERITQQQLEEWTHDLSKGRTLEDTRTEELRGGARKTAEAIQGMNPNPTTSKTCPSPPLTFHLHHPSLPSPRPVLIPLPPTTNLLTTLPSRLVLEFPTIYVLHSQPSNKLPENFISEEEFFDKAGKEMVTEVEEGEIGDDGELGMGGGVEREEGEVDERRLIEVLGRDLGGGEGGL